MQKLNILLVFNRISDFKREVHQAFVNTLGSRAEVDLFVQPHNTQHFEELIAHNIDRYDCFVIMLHYNGVNEDALKILNTIPPHKLILIDKRPDLLKREFGCVYQDFEDDIFRTLHSASEPLHKYNSLFLVYPSDRYYPIDVKWGFERFCKQQGFTKCQVVNEIEQDTVGRGQSYLVISEAHLAQILKICRAKNLKVGQDVGVISYNYAAYKEVLDGGITVVATDFGLMGQKAAELILSGSREHFRLPFRLELRASL